MKKLFYGKPIVPGIAIAKLAIYAGKGIQQHAVRKAVGQMDVKGEHARLEAAYQKADAALSLLCQNTERNMGQEAADILGGQQAILSDPLYRAYAHDLIESALYNAAEAAFLAGEYFAQKLAESNEARIQLRAADVQDLSQRLVQLLEETPAKDIEEDLCFSEPVILLADALTPSEAVRLSGGNICGVVLRQGAKESHTAILLRSRGIPALIETAYEADEISGAKGILDAGRGMLLIEPDAKEEALYQAVQRQEAAKQAALLQLRGKESVTKDGQKLSLCANIDGLEDLELAVQNDAEGIGLFRTEFLYLASDSPPTEDMQFAIYRAAALRMKGKPVVIRALDLGAEKQPAYLPQKPVQNPALGLRGIRILLREKTLFQTQLRAIFRAALYGNLSVMYPMIAAKEELSCARALAAEVCRELTEEGIPFSAHVPQGIMIETPAAAVLSDELAKEADFFSIGTNDLTQYTLAADRQDPELSSLFGTRQEAVLRLIRMTAANAKNAGIPVGICGEMGADASLCALFLQMGIDTLSVAPPRILPLRQAIRAL